MARTVKKYICLQCGRSRFGSWIGTIPSSFLACRFHGQGSLVGYSPKGHRGTQLTVSDTFTFTTTGEVMVNKLPPKCVLSFRCTWGVVLFQGLFLPRPAEQNCCVSTSCPRLWSGSLFLSFLLSSSPASCIHERSSNQVNCKRDEALILNPHENNHHPGTRDPFWANRNSCN